MNDLSGTVRTHARLISDEQLERVSGRLARLAPDERIAVDELAHSLAGQIADSLLTAARCEPTLAVALDSIYGAASGGGRQPSFLAGVGANEPADQPAPLPAN
jgi:hypothetical protein